MSVNVASIASRGRRVYNQQTVLHVLRLVHSHYTPIPHPVIRQHSPTIGRSTFDGVNAARSVASLRRYGNARAVQEEEVVSDDHDLPHVDEPPLSESDPGLVGSSSDLRDIPPDLLHFIERDDNINLPYRLDGDVLDPQPAQQLYADLFSGRYKSVADLVSADLDPISLASLSAIRAILLTFEQRGVTEGQWIWLAQRLAALRDCVAASRIDVDVRLSPLIYLIAAYCISQSAQRLDRVSADRSRLIRRLLHKAAMSRDSILRKMAAPPPLESTLSAVLLARLGDWDAAKQSMYGAFTTGNLKKRYHRIDLRFISQYHAILERNERLDDFYDIITKKADAIVNALTRAEPQSDAAQPRQSVVSTALGQTLLGLLGRIERVDRWYADVVQTELRSGAKREEDVRAGPSDITSRDVAGKMSKPTRALGSLLFMAFSSKPERMGDTQGLLRQLFYHDIWPPAHRVADFCEILTAAGRQNNVLEAYNRLTRVQGEWSAQLLRRFISILLRNDLAVEADELHAELVKLPSATSRDRTMVAFHYAQKGNVDAVEENLQRTFGAEWLKVIESLAMLLEVWLARRTRAKVKRFVTLIAKFARTQTSHLNYLLNHYAQRGQVSEGLAVFNSFLDRRRGNKPDLGTFSALIRLFGRQGDSRNVDRIVQGAVESGIALTGPFCAQIVEAGIRSQNWLTVSRRWSAFPPDIKAHPFVVAAIMKAFVYLAVPYDFVLSFFRTIDKPGHSHWHMILLSACDARKMLDAEKMLLAMERRALHQQNAPLPDKFIYATVMHGYLRLNQMDHAEQTFNRMATRKLVPTGVTFAMMIDAFDRNYPAANTVEQAYRFSVTVFERQHRGIQPGDDGSVRRFARYNFYARLIRMAGARGMRRRVDALYHEATRNMEPTIATQTLVMQAYYRMGHTRSAQRLWTDMYKRALRVIGTEPTGLSDQVPQSNVLCQALTMILTMSSDDGDHDKVVSIWKEVSNAGFGLDSASYNAYARALAKTGNIDGALHVLEHVLSPRVEASKDAAARTYGAAGGLESLTAAEDTEVEDAARTQGNVGSDVTSAAPDAGPVIVEPAQLKDAEIADSSSSSAAASSTTHENDSDFWQANAAVDANINIDSEPKPTPPPSRYLAPGYRPSAATTQAPQTATEADPARPSDKRPEERSILQTTPIAVDSSVAPASDVLTRDVLENWRPGNASWKPSSGLCSVLCALLGQLQRQAQQSRSKSKRAKRTISSKPLDPVYLRKGVDIPLRARDGTVWRALPADILAHYRARYPRAVEMIYNLRAERAASPTGGKINSWTRRAVRLNEAIRVAPARKKRELFALRARRSALFQPRAKRLSRKSPWRSLRKWQEVMETIPEQWAQLKARSAERRMANVSVYKGNWSLVRPSRPVGTRAPSMADLKAEEDPTRRAEMAQRLEEMVRLSSVLAKKEVVQREQAIAPRRKIRPRAYGLEAKREEREIKVREKSNPQTKSKLSRQQRRRQKQRERKAEGEQAR